MQLVKADDYTWVQDQFVNGAASIMQIAPGVVRVTFFADYEEPTDGDRQRKIVGAQVWSLPQLADNLLVMLQVIKEMGNVERKPRLALVEGMH
jgi:hypothetical protein